MFAYIHNNTYFPRLMDDSVSVSVDFKTGKNINSLIAHPHQGMKFSLMWISLFLSVFLHIDPCQSMPNFFTLVRFETLTQIEFVGG